MPTCEAGNVEHALPDASHAELLAQLDTGLDAYRTTGGVWLSDQPILLNEAFDFGVAMGMEGIGPGLAAGKRLDANRGKASALAPLRLPDELLRRLDRLRACGVHVFAVLWGSESPELQLAVDVYRVRETGAFERAGHRAELRTLSLQGNGSAADAAAVEGAFADALETALVALRAGPHPKGDAAPDH